MAPSIGVNIRVTGHCNQGGRRYMEDAFSVAYQQSHDELDLEFSYFGIFDGHGGREAALFAKQHLMNFIVGHKNFWSDKDENVLKAIKEGFLATHMAMWKQVGKWPQTVSGLPSTSGTTASVVFIRKGKMYVGHVGDSAIVLGYKEPDSLHYSAQPLTCDHKPESPAERKRIEEVGGCVMNKCGVQRVVWNRPRIGHKGPIRRSTHIDHIPFLAVARSLGDLWSYDYFHGQFIVSPEPDVSVVTIDPKRDRCIVLATDGVWNMVSSREAVRVVEAAEYENERRFLIDETRQIGCKPWVNPSKLLVNRALELWNARRKRADNTTVVIVMLDPPGPPKSEVLLRRRMLQRLRPRDESLDSSPAAGYADARSRLMMTRPLPPPLPLPHQQHPGHLPIPPQPPLQPATHHHSGSRHPATDEALIASGRMYRQEGAIVADYRPPLPPKTRHPVASGLPYPPSSGSNQHQPHSHGYQPGATPDPRQFQPQPPPPLPPPPTLQPPTAFFPAFGGYDESTLRTSRTPPLLTPRETTTDDDYAAAASAENQHPKPVPLHRTSRWSPSVGVAEIIGVGAQQQLPGDYFYVRGQRLPDTDHEQRTPVTTAANDVVRVSPQQPLVHAPERRHHHHHHHHHHDHQHRHHRTPPATSTDELTPSSTAAVEDPLVRLQSVAVLADKSADVASDSVVVATQQQQHTTKLASSALKRKLPPGARELFTLVSKHSRLNQYGRGRVVVPTPNSLLSMCALAAEAGARGPHVTRSSKIRLLRKAPSL